MVEPTATPPPPPGRVPDAVDVAVVGGGIAGVSAAYHLASAGVDVLLVERGEVGGGATASAVGLLGPAMRQPFHDTVRFRGLEAAREAWRFAHRSVADLVDVLDRHGRADDVGLDRGGTLVLAEDDTLDDVRDAFDALQRADLPVRWLTADEARARSGGGAFAGGWHMDGGGGVDPVSTVRALADLARAAGALVLEGVEAREVRRLADHLRLDTSAGSIACEMVVYATHVESRRFSAFLGDEVVPVLGQGLATEPDAGARWPGAFSTHWKMNAWRQDPAGRWLLGGWRWNSWNRSYWKMRPDVDDALQADLVAWFENTFPERAPLRVARRWGGVFGWTADYLPLAGPLPGSPRELVIAGFSGGGLAFAFGAGRVVASAVAGLEPVPGASLLNPRRFA